MGELDIVTRDGRRLKGDVARKFLDQRCAAADAILLERAVEVLKRRCPDGLKYDVAWLEHYAGLLRQEAES